MPAGRTARVKHRLEIILDVLRSLGGAALISKLREQLARLGLNMTISQLRYALLVLQKEGKIKMLSYGNEKVYIYMLAECERDPASCARGLAESLRDVLHAVYKYLRESRGCLICVDRKKLRLSAKRQWEWILVVEAFKKIDPEGVELVETARGVLLCFNKQSVIMKLSREQDFDTFLKTVTTAIILDKPIAEIAQMCASQV
jgi:hypothetical protein